MRKRRPEETVGRAHLMLGLAGVQAAAEHGRSGVWGPRGELWETARPVCPRASWGPEMQVVL